jgi:hypothetical protein
LLGWQFGLWPLFANLHHDNYFFLTAFLLAGAFFFAAGFFAVAFFFVVWLPILTMTFPPQQKTSYLLFNRLWPVRNIRDVPPGRPATENAGNPLS